MEKMKKRLSLLTSPPLLSLLVLSIMMTSAIALVNYWEGTQTITQSFGEGGTAVFNNIALPVAYLGTPDTHIEPNALNVTTFVPNTIFSWTQASSQRTNAQGFYNSLILTVKDASTDAVLVTMDLLLDLSANLDLTGAGDYPMYYEIAFESKVSSGTFQVDLSLSLDSAV
jgi:hypothetical protein